VEDFVGVQRRRDKLNLCPGTEVLDEVRDRLRSLPKHRKVFSREEQAGMGEITFVWKTTVYRLEIGSVGCERHIEKSPSMAYGGE
jgi:hypothetical protein